MAPKPSLGGSVTVVTSLSVSISAVTETPPMVMSIVGHPPTNRTLSVILAADLPLPADWLATAGLVVSRTVGCSVQLAHNSIRDHWGPRSVAAPVSDFGFAQGFGLCPWASSHDRPHAVVAAPVYRPVDGNPVKSC